MRAQRIPGAVWGLILVLLWLFAGAAQAASLTGGTLLVLAGDVLWMFGLRGRIRTQVAAGRMTEKGRKLPGELLVKNRAYLPAPRVEVLLATENALTGECTESRFITAIPAKGEGKILWEMESRFCGQVRISLKQIGIRDPLGLFRIKESGTEEKTLLVLPNIFPAEVTVTESLAADMESLQYSSLRRGEDPGEIFGLREYRPGDSVRDIHWKLSGKMEELYIKELGMPIENSILLLYETGAEEKRKEHPRLRDAMMEALLSISQALIGAGHVHQIGWYDSKLRQLRFCEVTSQDELASLTGGLLGIRAGQTDQSSLSCYLEEYPMHPFAHVVYFAQEAETREISRLNQLCTAVTLQCVTEAGKSRKGEGALLFTPEEKEIQLCQVAI